MENKYLYEIFKLDLYYLYIHYNNDISKFLLL